MLNLLVCNLSGHIKIAMQNKWRTYVGRIEFRWNGEWEYLVVACPPGKPAIIHFIRKYIQNFSRYRHAHADGHIVRISEICGTIKWPHNANTKTLTEPRKYFIDAVNATELTTYLYLIWSDIVCCEWFDSKVKFVMQEWNEMKYICIPKTKIRKEKIIVTV